MKEGQRSIRDAADRRGELAEELSLFLSLYPIDLSRADCDTLAEIARSFSRLPYENLTKIIRRDSEGRAAKRGPREVLRDHLAWGTGGTCFSLTHTLTRLLRALGFEAAPILADRRYGTDTHCALRVELGGEARLIDPGYLILRPVTLNRTGETRLKTSFNELILAPRGNGDRVDLYTAEREGRAYRLTFKTSPVDEAEFFRAWDASFDWDMMRYPLLTCVRGGRQVYLQGQKLRCRSHEGLERREIPRERLVERIAAEFGVDPRVTERAVRILDRQGESRGDAPAP